MRFFTTRVLFFFGVAGVLLAPSAAGADDVPDSCSFSPVRTYGYYFEDFENAEYLDGLLHMHLRLSPRYNDGRGFYAQVIPVASPDDTCVSESISEHLPPVSFTPDVADYSFRMMSPTHWVLWDDENDVQFECEHCSGDIPAGTEYVSFVGRIDSRGSAIFTVPRPPVVPREPETCCDSVLFLPGITGSRLYRSGDLPFSDRKLWEPFRNGDAEELALNPDGSSVNEDVYAKNGDVVEWAYGPVGPKIYRSFLDMLGTLKDEGTISDFEAVPYDWRLSFDDILTKGTEREGRISYTVATDTPYIAQELKRLAAGSQTGKVTIVAHSMGGLVAKELLRRLGDEDAQSYVSRLIMVGSPQIGTPKAIASMLHGYGQEIAKGYFLDSAHARAFSVNSPSAYALLPSGAYLDGGSDPAILFPEASESFASETSLFGRFITSMTGLFSFLLNDDGRPVPVFEDTESAGILDRALLADASRLHEGIDAWQPPTGIEVDQIAGQGIDTVNGIEYYFGKRKRCFPGVGVTGVIGGYEQCVGPTVRPVFTTKGDGTVVSQSATFMKTRARRFWFDLAGYNQSNGQASHGTLFEASPVIEFIRSSVLRESPPSPFISESEPGALPHLRFRLHSPLTIDLYDSSGRHTGVSTTAGPGPDIHHIDTDIPNSYYLEFGDVTYLGASNSQAITVVMNGYATSTFQFDIEQLTGDTVTASTSFSGIPVTPETHAVFVIDGTLVNTSHLDVDEDGDGVPDISLAPVAGQTVLYTPPVEEPMPTASTSPEILSSPGFSNAGGFSAPDTSLTVAIEAASSTGPVITLPATTTETAKAIEQTSALRAEESPRKQEIEENHPSTTPPPSIQNPPTQTASVIQAVHTDWYRLVAGMFQALIQISHWFGRIE